MHECKENKSSIFKLLSKKMKYLSNSYISIGFSGRGPNFAVSFMVTPEIILLMLTWKIRTRLKRDGGGGILERLSTKMLLWDKYFYSKLYVTENIGMCHNKSVKKLSLTTTITIALSYQVRLVTWITRNAVGLG